ncbi:ABC-F family ATP-binding cassette domain-containing protein [Listeria monocytogenes]|uniref:ABC-F family ATP-binding cassette domain-containing protein n=1 Tax=Listeria monocytogenes TaxID=1639 RepID=A0A823IN90_LISMN|nr:ATP-binding cassette domain-containing protein [Listeria monocytogenes]EAG9221150.1 ABC-F family ATP-binding cassette domain-containing protein [Listeria monocytogenes]EAG9290011.1 ABC-F family ATP-binding cassette domain-containing protein [Listeria monocytogenes]EAG9353014.1 ABC-F family ATP-binding cassette domain-containing protein [Listeria monocytogenes]EGN0216069.1 ABC-F family ATP-binding cassette domain-containing protein [Listeria monocytogenes]EHR3849580.1 ABC-F family ATP-bindin
MNKINKFSIFSITKPGIYTITGSNGSGKTTFIENELKNNTNKVKDVAYFAQKNWKYKTSVEKYLHFPKTNPSLIQKYCELFSVDNYYLEKDIQLLSGGEFVKVELVRTLALDAPIIILDEPTNNLDNKSSEILANILSELAKTKIIYLVSHDTRLEHFFDKTIFVDKDRIEVSSKIEIEQNEIQVKSKRVVSNGRILKYLLSSKFNFLMFAFIIVLTILLTNITSTIILRSVPIEENLTSDYNFELMDIAENYSRYFNIEMTESEIEDEFQEPNYLTTNELIELQNKDYIKQIYVVDESYINEFVLDNSKFEVLALPEIITDSPNYVNAFPVTKMHLTKGRFPKDDAKEIALSFTQLKKFFRDDISEVSAIGNKLEFENELYEIVGIVNSPVAAISYSKQVSKGTVEVDDKASEKLNNILLKLEKENYDNPNFSIISIKLANKNQHELLNYLKVHGPSYQYASNYVDSVSQVAFYKQNLAKILLISVIFSLIVSVLIFIFGRKSFSLINGFLNDMSNLNFKPRKNKRFIYVIMILDFLLSMPACLLVSRVIIGDNIGMLMILPTLGVSAIMFMLTLLLMSYRDKKNDFRNL